MRYPLQFGVISFILYCLPISVFGQSVGTHKHLQGNFAPPATPPVITARQVQRGTIVLDGNVAEKAWMLAEEVRDFFQHEPVQGASNKHATSVRVLFDDQYLYFGVVCRDSMGRSGVRVQDLRRDFVYGENDFFGIQLDPQNLKRYCVSFQVTPYGSQRDLQVFNDEFRDNDWDALWQVRTAITDSGWTAEFAIPFATLRYDNVPDTAMQDNISWGVSFFRLARRDYEQTSFPPVPQSYSPYRMVYAAQLRGLRLPKPSVNLRVQPYALYELNSTKAMGNDASSVQSVPKFGGDAKWAIKPDATIDITFNTDFAQADVDRAVNNLTRFNLFFPERRQFFLENSGVFPEVDNSFVRPFFSRTIGLENTQFAANPVGLDAGVRYVERNADRAMAGMFVRQRATERQSAANFGLVRYVQNFGAQNSVGAMLTHRYDDASQILNFSGRHNTTFTADALWRPIDELTVTAMISGSSDNPLTDASRPGIQSSTGLAGNMFAGYNTNTMYVGTLHSFATERYLPGMGFVAQSNTVFHNPGGYAIIRPKERTWWRRWDPGAFLNVYHNANDGTFQQASIDIFPLWFFFQDNAFVRYSVIPTWQNINFDFAPVGVEIEQGRYFYVRHVLQYSSDASAQLSGVVRGEFGGYFNGTLTTLYSSIRYAPLPNVALTAEYERNQFFTIGKDNENLTTNLLTSAVRLAVNPQLQVSVFYQYNSFDRRSRWNVRGSWEFMPLSFLYIVFNDSMIQPIGQRTQAFISKLVYTHQF